MSSQGKFHSGRTIAVAIIGGILLTGASVFLVGVSRDFPITSHAHEITCQNADPYKTTETVHGFPFGFLKTYENSCITMENEWQPVALAADIAIWTAVTVGAILLTQKVRSEHE